MKNVKTTYEKPLPRKVKGGKLITVAMMSLIFSMITMINTQSYSQGVSINGTGARADTSAMLDVESTIKGLLIPRMSTVQRNSIVSPAIGLRIFNNTTNCDNIYMGNYWKQVCGECDFTPSVAGSNSPVNAGNTLNLTATTVAGATYFWTGPNSFTSSQQNPSISNFQVAEAGNYFLTTSVNTCTSTASVVNVTKAPFVPVVTTFLYTGSEQTYVVPAGGSGVNFELYGPEGAYDTRGYYGGKGGKLSGQLPIAAGTTIYLYIGNKPGNDCSGAGWNGGGSSSCYWGYESPGAGMTDIRINGNSTSNIVAVAGGGGGAGGGNWGNTYGGPGGGTIGGSGWTANWNSYNYGGSQTGAGYCSTCGCCYGSQWQGAGGCSSYGGGGGGGGYFGGGGGCYNGGGGGGSSWTNSSILNVLHTQGFQSGNGVIKFTTYE